MYHRQHILDVSVFVHGFCSYLLTKYLLSLSMNCSKMMETQVSKKMMYRCPSVSFPQNFTVATHWRWTWFTLTIKESWTLMAAYPGRSWPLVLKHGPVIACRKGIIDNLITSTQSGRGRKRRVAWVPIFTSAVALLLRHPGSFPAYSVRRCRGGLAKSRQPACVWLRRILRSLHISRVFSTVSGIV